MASTLRTLIFAVLLAGQCVTTVTSAPSPGPSAVIEQNALPPLDYAGPQCGNSTAPPPRRTVGSPAHSAATHNYYSGFFGSLDAAQAAIAGRPGAVVVGRIGQLQTAWLFAIPIGQNVTGEGATGASRRSDVGSGAAGAPLFTALTLKQWTKRVTFTDPGYSGQFHLRPASLNASSAWNQGIDGKNATIAIVDDGLDSTTADLSPNFYASGSYDFNAQTASPNPKLGNDDHGTQCAGLAAGSANTTCGVGVAYRAQLAGIRLVATSVSTAVEAAAMNWQFQSNHIYSCSWGPADDAQTVDTFSAVTMAALQNGVTNGRGGKGSIYVFASGNGGYDDDSCGYDGVSSNPYSMSIAAIDSSDRIAPFGERCAAILTATYGVNTYTSSVSNTCAASFSGTSAAAPIASGTAALLLSYRPELTWRDVHDIYRKAAVPVDPTYAAAPWTTLPSGLKYSESYGYGKISVSSLMAAAQNHTLLGAFAHKSYPTVAANVALTNATVASSSYAVANMSVPFKVERVVATITLDHSYRGSLLIMLTSPAGVTSYLAYPRPLDTSRAGLQAFPFVSVKHWGEQAYGNWTLSIKTMSASDSGMLRSWSLDIFGEGNVPTDVNDWLANPMYLGLLIAGVAAVVLLLVCCCCCCWLRRRRAKNGAVGSAKPW